MDPAYRPLIPARICDRSAVLAAWEDVHISPTEPDTVLVHRLRMGDMEALGVLYARYGGDVRSVCLRLAPDQGPEFADDTCQAVFLVFLDTLGRYEEQGKLRSWLFGITARRCRSARRQWWRRLSIHRRAGVASAGLAAPLPSAPERMAAREAVVRALTGLPDAQREVLVLHVLEGMEIDEVALVLNISENAVSTRLYRARRAMEASR